jgi:hypothetical protein
MGTGYTRADVSNNIADGNIINASDLDGEFDAVQAAFDAATGHTHDGTTGEGAPIEVTGPAQEYVSTNTELRPKANNTYDLGSASNQWKDLYVDGTANLDTVDIDAGNIDGTTIGAAAPAAGTFTTAAATTGNITTVNATTVDTTNIEVTNLKAKDGTAAGSIADSTGVVTIASSVLTTTDINGGTIDGTTIGGASAAAGTFTTATATTGNITTVNATTVDSTNVEVTNIKAKDGTASATIADSTGVMTIASSVLTTADINGGTIDGVTIGGASAGAGTFTTLTTTGNVTFGDAATDTVTFTADVASNLIPSADNTYDLGASGSEWKDLYIDGTANIDSLVADTADINGGTIDGTVIGGSTPAAGTFTTGQFDTSLNVDGTVTADGLTVDGATVLNNSNANVDFTVKGDNGTALFVDGGTGDISFYEDTGSLPRFFWDASAESLGIGTTAPSAPLTVGVAYGGTPNIQSRAVFQSDANAYLTIGAGTSSDSGILFADSGDNDVGAITYTHSTNAMAFKGAGSERMRIDSSGNVGIGTSSPSTKLTIQDNGVFYRAQNTVGGFATFGCTDSAESLGQINCTNALLFQVGDTERMRITSAGNVGIGTSSPAFPLTISNSGATFTGSFKSLFDARDGSADNRGISLGYVDGQNVASIISTTSSAGSAINFVTFSGSAWGERMRIDSSGNVGIGTTSPSSYPVAPELVIDANTNGGITIKSGASNYGGIFFADGTTGDEQFRGFVQYNHNYLGSTDSLLLGTAGTIRMTINSNGNVGVGTSSPTNNVDWTTLSLNSGTNGGLLELLKNGTRTFLMFNPSGTSDTLLQAESGNGLRFATAGTERARIDASGKLLIGQTAVVTGARQELTYTGGLIEYGIALRALQDTTTAILFRNAANGVVGSIDQTASATSYVTSSDYRLKEDVQPMVGASDRLMALKPVNFAWKVDGSRVDGFLAHEAQEVVPEAVTGSKDAVDKDGKPQYQGIDQSKIVPLLTAALQEALTEIADLKARVAALEA